MKVHENRKHVVQMLIKQAAWLESLCPNNWFGKGLTRLGLTPKAAEGSGHKCSAPLQEMLLRPGLQPGAGLLWSEESIAHS